MDPVVVIICVLLLTAVVACVWYLHQRWTLCCPACGALYNRARGSAATVVARFRDRKSPETKKTEKGTRVAPPLSACRRHKRVDGDREPCCCFAASMGELSRLPVFTPVYGRFRRRRC